MEVLIQENGIFAVYVSQIRSEHLSVLRLSLQGEGIKTIVIAARSDLQRRDINGCPDEAFAGFSITDLAAQRYFLGEHLSRGQQEAYKKKIFVHHGWNETKWM